MNYAVNQRKELETNIYVRASKMLESIAASEKENLRNIISKETIEALNEAIQKIKTESALKKLALESAIDGIKKGTMDYSKDPFLPLLQSILGTKLSKIKNLTPEEYRHYTDKSNLYN